VGRAAGLGERCVMELAAFEFPLAGSRGFPTRLAKDCGLLDTLSSGTNLDLLDCGEAEGDSFALPIRSAV
jgi:hypothetical protein